MRNWLALTLSALAACGGAEAMPAPAAPTKAAAAVAPAEVGFFPGETMSFEVGLAGITAGEAVLAVGQVGQVDGHRAIVVTSRAATTGAAALVKSITDEATTTIDLDTGAPLVLDTAVEMGGKKSSAHAVFAPKSVDVTYARPEEAKPHTQHITFGATGVLDSHSAMAQIRTWKPAPGATRSLWVIGGRRVWRVDVKYIGPETIGSALGNRETLRYEGGSFRGHANLTIEPGPPTRTFTVWLTDDADRVPLKMAAHTELGDVTMALTDYARP